MPLPPPLLDPPDDDEELLPLEPPAPLLEDEQATTAVTITTEIPSVRIFMGAIERWHAPSRRACGTITTRVRPMTRRVPYCDVAARMEVIGSAAFVSLRTMETPVVRISCAGPVK